jgi:dienelactone hydrolase
MIVRWQVQPTSTLIAVRAGLVASWLAICTLLAFPASAQIPPAPGFTKERVSFQSGDLKLEGFLFKPEGAVPHPGIVWNHGSEKDPDARSQLDAVAAAFVPAGFVVFAPLRRGHGGSEGPYIGQELQQARSADRTRLQVQLLESEQLDDQLAGLAFFKSLAFVDQSRIAVAGCSYGGIQSLLAAERGAGLRAAVAISPAALSWSANPLLQQRLVVAAQRTEIPVFLIQPPQDASLEPIRVLGREFQRLGKAYRGKIYPADIPDDLQTHCFGGVAKGSRVWASDVLAFLAEVMR